LEITQYTNLLHLFQCYKKYYDQGEVQFTTALNKFSHYLNLKEYFSEMLNHTEMMVLLAMVSDARHKQAAELITVFQDKPCPVRTVSTYVSLIKNKLKTNIDIHMILRDLRNLYQLKPYLPN
jgi:hypothetical protein